MGNPQREGNSKLIYIPLGEGLLMSPLWSAFWSTQLTERAGHVAGEPSAGALPAGLTIVPRTRTDYGDVWLQAPLQEQLGFLLKSSGKPCQNDKQTLQLGLQPVRTPSADLFLLLRAGKRHCLQRNLSLQTKFCNSARCRKMPGAGEQQTQWVRCTNQGRQPQRHWVLSREARPWK